MDERGDRELNMLSDKKARTMTGSVVASLAHLKDVDGNDGAFFVFPDLSVRCEGVYRLKFSLFEIVGNQVFFCKSITSTTFNVFSAKKFPGMDESTHLTKLFAEQGLKIRVRKEQKAGRPKGARSRPITTALHPDPAAHMSVWSPEHASFAAPGGPGPVLHAPPLRAPAAPSQSPQPAGSAPRHHYPPAPPPSQQQQQQHQQPPQLQPQPLHRHQPGAYPRPPAAPLPASVPDARGIPPHYHQHQHIQNQHNQHQHHQHMVHASPPYQPHLQTAPHRLPPSYDPAMRPLDRPTPYPAGDAPAARSASDYHEHARLPQPYPPYRPADDARQPLPHPSYGHPHRPWSPHHRVQQHYVPTPPGHPPASDPRYSPYGRVDHSARDGRQHAPPPRHLYPPHAGMHAGPHAPRHPGYPRLSSSTPETPAAPADRPAPHHSQYQPQQQPLPGADRQPNAHQHTDPAVSPPGPEPIGGPPQRRIAVHSLLISDSSSSPERPRRSN
ncbi:hypothetical protein H4R19_000040 [Coemansia spiralis]|nr:hypothetical protein H4R19_000040 [Coemansia spiralis]